MSNSQPKIVVCFDDTTLGGTSRSAILSGEAWRLAGCSVAMYPFRAVHPGRVEKISALGKLLSSLDEVDWSSVSAVHYHHGSFNAAQLSNVALLSRAARGLNGVPPLISNNIFAHNDHPLDSWPGRRVVCLLGDWALQQYRCSRLQVPAAVSTCVIPNAQDTAFFRPPSTSERAAAKDRLGLPDKPTVLRVGSPLMDKWSLSYAPLVEQLRNIDATLVAIGCPEALANRVSSCGNVRLVSPLADDVLLRDYYWATDVFAHDAERGESFGNVLLEALLCGLPVVYRARPLRDNTPREFGVAPHFHYVSSEPKWISGVLRYADGTERATVDTAALVSLYAIEEVSRLQMACLDSLVKGESLSQAERVSPLGLLDRSKVAVRHNPVASWFKSVRNRNR